MSEAAASTETSTEASTETSTTEAASWREDFDNHPALSDFPDSKEEAFGVIAKSFLDTKELVGRKGVILAKDGDAADQDRFYNELGRPETAEGYTLKGFEPPKDIPWDSDFQTAMLSVLHKAGAPDEMVTKIFSGYSEVEAARWSAAGDTMGKARTDAEAELKKELGVDYDKAVALSNRAFGAAAGEHSDAIKGILLKDGTELGNHPGFIRVFMNIGKQLGEHGFLGGKDSGGFVMSKEAALQEIKELQANPALYEKDHSEHAAVMSKMNDLNRMAYPAEKETG